MDIRFIDKETKLDIEVGEDEFFGEFVYHEEGLTFTFKCEELANRLPEYKKGVRAHFTFYRGADLFTFEARLHSATVERDYEDVIQATATTYIEKTTRRKSYRIEMSIPVRIYSDEKFLCEGTTQDVSNQGICALSNDDADFDATGIYITEFSLTRGQVFRIPSKFVRKGSNPKFVGYKWDYTFAFTHEEEGKSYRELTLALLNSRINTLN